MKGWIRESTWPVFILFTGVFLAYRLFANATVVPGTVCMVLNAEKGEFGRYYFWHVGHVLFDFTAFWLFQAWKILGWHDRALVPLQTMNAFFGALAAGILYLLLFSMTRKSILSLLLSLVFAFSYSFWYFSSEVKFYPLAAALLLLSILIFMEAAEEGGRIELFLAAGISSGVSILYHLMNALLLPAFMIVILSSERRPGRKVLELFSYGVPACLIPWAVYHLIFSNFRVMSLFEMPKESTAELSGYFVSVLKGVISGPQFLLGDLNTAKTFSWLSMNLPFMFAGILLIFVLASLPRMLKEQSFNLTVSIFLLIAFIGGFVYFKPYCSYIYITLIPLLMMLGIAASQWIDGRLSFLSRRTGSYIVYITLTLMTVLVFLANLKDQIYPDHFWENNRLYASVVFDRKHVGPGSAMIARGEEEYYYRYFMGCPVIPAFDNSPEAQTSNRGQMEIFEEKLRKALSEGHKIFFHQSGDIPYLAMNPENLRKIKSALSRNGLFLKEVARMDDNNILFVVEKGRDPRSR